MKIKIYKTENLNEVVFLTLKGYRHSKIKHLGELHNEWTFKDMPDAFFKQVKEFWNGSPVISLNKWIMVRFELKGEMKNVKGMVKKTTVRKRLVVTKIPESKASYPYGTKYYYINHHNRPILSTFGKAKSNEDRVKSGNFFLKIEDANQRIKDNEENPF